ncbi:MAG: DapH/DapD/GlmU-related protein [Bacilli bacterium]
MEATKVYGNDTGEGVPKTGFMEKVFLYIEHVCGKKSVAAFIIQGVIFIIFKEFPTIVGSYIRPMIYSILFAKIKSGCLFERGIRFEIPGRMSIGKNVFLGERCWIGVGTKDGNINVGDNSFIAHSCTLAAQGGTIAVGNHVHMSRNSYINGIGDVFIGNDCMLGPNVVIISGSHVYQNTEVPIRLQGSENKAIIIEENVWLAASVNVMPGVRIGEGSVIGAGAVVTKDIPPFSVAVGVPARVIKNRKEL